MYIFILEKCSPQKNKAKCSKNGNRELDPITDNNSHNYYYIAHVQNYISKFALCLLQWGRIPNFIAPAWIFEKTELTYVFCEPWPWKVGPGHPCQILDKGLWKRGQAPNFTFPWTDICKDNERWPINNYGLANHAFCRSVNKVNLKRHNH